MQLLFVNVGAYVLGSSGKILEPSAEEVCDNYYDVLLAILNNNVIVASLTNDVCASNKEKICGIGKDYCHCY